MHSPWCGAQPVASAQKPRATMADAIYGSARVALKFKGDEDVRTDG